jgi:hypothetical protein
MGTRPCHMKESIDWCNTFSEALKKSQPQHTQHMLNQQLPCDVNIRYVKGLILGNEHITVHDLAVTCFRITCTKQFRRKNLWKKLSMVILLHNARPLLTVLTKIKLVTFINDSHMILWVEAPCNVAGRYWQFRRTCYLYHQGWYVYIEELAWLYMRVRRKVVTEASALEMKAECSSKILVSA